MNHQVALLQTDIVDSTLLAERLGDRALSALRSAHDGCARDLLEVWNGHELERSDGFLLQFDSAMEALGYASAYHRALRELSVSLQARVGLHVGLLETRANSDAHVRLGARLFDTSGLVIPTTVRVMSVALGGQTLVTAEARATLGTSARRVHSHGFWRLKGLEAPLELFEIGMDDEPFRPPLDASKAYRVVRRNGHWLPSREVPTSLPAERNAFVGRKRDLATIGDRFDAGARLISMVGYGGIGKTRIATHFGWSRLGDFPGGVWFCDLSQATTFDGLCGAVAQGLTIPLAQRDAVAQIADAIAGRGECLVIFDNCEQIVDHVLSVIGHWLDRAMSAHFLITTRSVLGIDGEEVLSLDSLPRVDAAELFLMRAKASRSDFKLAADEEALLEKTVVLLEGLPLAIELAAARVRMLSLASLHDRMRDRFRLLASSQGRPGRQATLHATFDWSWDLLSFPERCVLAQLSVFEGGFTLVAAEQVIELSPRSTPAVIDVVQSLIEKSWVQRSSDRRFALLGSVQEYALEQLAKPAHQSAARSLNERHWSFYGSLKEIEATADRCVDIDNLVVAVRRSTSSGDSRAATAVLRRCGAALKLCGPFRTAVELGKAIRILPDLSAADRAWVDYVIGNGLRYNGHNEEARHSLESGLLAAEEAGVSLVQARLLSSLAEQNTAAARYEDATRQVAAAQQIACGLSDYVTRCIVLNAEGILAQGMGETQKAVAPYTNALTLARDAQDPHWEGGLLGNLGGVYHTLGRLDEARTHYEQALELVQRSGDQRWEGNTRCNLGLLLQELGLHERSRTELELALTKARELGFVRLEYVVSSNLGLLAEETGAVDEADERFRHAIDLADRLGDHRVRGEARGYRAALFAGRGALAAATTFFTEAESLFVEASDGLGRTQLLCARARMHWAAGDHAATYEVWDRIQEVTAQMDLQGHAITASLEKLRSDLEVDRSDPNERISSR